MRKTLVMGAFAAMLFGISPSLAEESPATVAGATTVTTTEAKALFDKGVKFVDLRPDADWEAGRIPGAAHLDFKVKFSEEALGAVVGKDQDVVLYCSGVKCMRAPEGSIKAVSWGYKKVHFYREGLPGWQAAGYPVE